MASNLMPEERKPPDTDSEDNGKCSISFMYYVMQHELRILVVLYTISKHFEANVIHT